MRKHTSQASTLADDPELVTESLGEGYILSIEWPQKRQRSKSSVDATQSSEELTPTTPRKGNPNHRNRSVAPFSSEMGFYGDVKRDLLPVGCTVEAHPEDGVSTDLACNATRPTEVSILFVAIKHSSVSAFLQEVRMLARDRS